MGYRFIKDSSEKEILESKESVLTDFYASWHGPRKTMTPVVEKLAKKYEGKVKVDKVNSDDEPELTQVFQIMSIPSFTTIKDGRVVGHVVSAVPQQALEGKLDAQLWDESGQRASHCGVSPQCGAFPAPEETKPELCPNS